MKLSRQSKIAIAIILLVGVAVQFTTPKITHPPVTGTLSAPEEVAQIYKRACYDCHSNETKLKWYDKIAPASWLVAEDVKEGRSRFNFSEWGKLSAADQQTILWETVNEMVAGKMPLRSYRALHPDAAISTGDIEVLKRYVNSLPNGKPADAGAAEAAANELRNFRNKNTGSGDIPVALNGVSYVTGYRQWQVITTPNRFDNYTIRVLYGNDIAIKAIKENKIVPFPKGATVVKVVWNKILDKEGNVTTGALNSIQIMTKDDDRFSKTGGWGFALFSGIKLMPFGETAFFETTCYHCHHDLARETGYVFDVPLPPAREMFDADNLEVIAPSMNRAQGTMSILYGNKAARLSTLDSGNGHKPGELYTLATWEQVNDPHWYGSNINGQLKSVETVSVSSASNGGVSVDFKLVKGSGPKDAGGHTIDPQDRMGFILHQQPTVFP
jgi:Haem-binding domain/Cytochrome P460